jgi:hypothetical protein
MKANKPKKLTYTDIGYQGKAIESLSRDELLGAFLDLAQRVYECAYEDNKCKDVFTVKK